jgi:hypothetical protein
MRLQFRSKNFRLHDAIREEMERRIRFALGRFVGRISAVIVGLADLNGPRGGMDKQCRLVVRLRPAGKVTIEETQSDVSAAVALAADRAGWNVGRELKRQRDARYDRRPREMLPDGSRSLDSH